MTATDRLERAKQAAEFIATHCPRPGAFHGSFAPVRLIHEAAVEMASAPHSATFPDRYKEHVAYALSMVAASDFTDPPAAIASVYLATRFEFYFRILSGKLNPNGTWVNPVAQATAKSAIADNRLNKNRISSVALAYRLMKLSKSRPVVQLFDSLDQRLYSTPLTVVGPMTVADLGDRIEFGRHAVGHGHWGDMSSEAIFYGLVTAAIFYCEGYQC